jgi:phosphoesterase RecJ-like protein
MLNQDQQIFEQIKKANNILITFNKLWNGDAVASALALYLFLKKLDKSVAIAAEKLNSNNLLEFLPAYDTNTSVVKVDKIKYKTEDNKLDFVVSPKDGFFTANDVKTYAGEFKYDLVIVLDSPDLESLGSVYENDTDFFYQVPIINFDHHSDNENFGQVNFVEITATSTSEILFNLLSDYSREMIDEDIATCLLAGIIAETKSFKTQNITPQALSTSAQLISMGARRDDIVNHLYRSRTLNVLKLWGRVLARLTSTPDNTLVWSMLNNSDFAKPKRLKTI